MKYVLTFFYYIMSFLFKRDFNFVDVWTVGILWKTEYTWNQFGFYAILIGGLLISAIGQGIYQSMKEAKDAA